MIAAGRYLEQFQTLSDIKIKAATLLAARQRVTNRARRVLVRRLVHTEEGNGQLSKVFLALLTLLTFISIDEKTLSNITWSISGPLLILIPAFTTEVSVVSALIAVNCLYGLPYPKSFASFMVWVSIGSTSAEYAFIHSLFGILACLPRLWFLLFFALVIPLQLFALREIFLVVLRGLETRVNEALSVFVDDLGLEILLLILLVPATLTYVMFAVPLDSSETSWFPGSSIAFVGSAVIISFAPRKTVSAFIAGIELFSVPTSLDSTFAEDTARRDSDRLFYILILTLWGDTLLFMAHGYMSLWALTTIPLMILAVVLPFRRVDRSFVLQHFPILVLGIQLLLCFSGCSLSRGKTDHQQMCNNLTMFYGLISVLVASCVQSLEQLPRTLAQLSIGAGLILLINREQPGSGFFFSICFNAVFIKVLSQAAGQRLISKDREAQNFLDHAVKQKFAGTGTALEIMLSDETLRDAMNPEVLKVLQVALSECRLGTTMCHEATIKRQILDGRYTGRRETLSLVDVTEEWSELWRDVIVAKPKVDVLVETDWDLLKNILAGLVSRTRLTSNMVAIHVELEYRQKHDWLVLEITGNLPINFPPLMKVLCDPIKALIHKSTSGARVEIPVNRRLKSALPAKRQIDVNLRKDKRGKPRERGNLQFLDSPEIVGPALSKMREGLPPGLVYAVLDDSALVRVNLKAILLKTFLGSPKSVILGETEQQALDFCRICLDEIQPDICILDENIDYSGDNGQFILGSTLAEDLRLKGYDGVIVIHSANDLLFDTLDYHIVDGFIRKGANRATVRSELARMYWTRKRLVKD